MKLLLAFVLMITVLAWAGTAQSVTILRLTSTKWYCTDLEKFNRWIDDSNKYGPILLENGVMESYGCSAKQLVLVSNKPLAMVRAFNTSVLAIEAESHLGTVYTFVPILQSLPFGPGNGA